MPVVGNKKFSYTPEGEAAAELYSKSSGSPVRKGYYAGGKVEHSNGSMPTGTMIETEQDRVQRRFGCS
jgi:hypothetical protein|tara:strand:- start:1094 stop:1297 length:204 start_codon:yes stop_codon:yes gene_type:complete